MSVPLPLFLKIFMFLTWPSAILYFYMSLVVWRNRRKFSSAYFPLMLSQAAADLITFLWAEIGMRARKYNYFDLYHEGMPFFAWFSYTTTIVLQTVMYTGHVLIAINRFTVFYFPLIQHIIWRHVNLYILFHWTLCFTVLLPYPLLNREGVSFRRLPNGILQLDGEHFYIFDLISVSITVVSVVFSISILYGLSCLFIWKKSRVSSKAERRLLLCAIFASAPLLVELSRIIIQTVGELREDWPTVAFTTEFWFYEIGFTNALAVWTHVGLNEELRRTMFQPFFLPVRKRTISVVVSMQSIEIPRTKRISKTAPYSGLHSG